MGDIVLEGLDFGRVRNWLESAKDKQRDDPVHSFISAWIGFNYYYSTFAHEHRDKFKPWAKTHFRGH